MKKIILIILTAISSFVAYAQNNNPYEIFGLKTKVEYVITNDDYYYLKTQDTSSLVKKIVFKANEGKILLFDKYENIVQSLNMEPSDLLRFLSVDPYSKSYPNASPYNFVNNNPIRNIDPDGRDWFNYQSKGEKASSWHYQKGDQATYTNSQGKQVTVSNGFDNIAFFNKTGTNSEGGTTGNIVVYHQDKPVLKVSTAFTGNSNFSGTAPIPNGNYMMLLGERDADGPNKLKADGSNPVPFAGIQAIPDNAKFEYKGLMFPMNPTVTHAYGNGRIRLNQTDANLNVIPMGEQTAGYYLHGKNDAHNWTHGCVCDKSEQVFDYFWSGGGKDIKTNVPFIVK
ncbi:MAG: hypothetical protein ABI851_13185 [Saprospiraceae bacterium]